MSDKTVHCSICSKSIAGFDFAERMAKLRRHYKKYHPHAFKKQSEKAVETKKEGGLIHHSPEPENPSQSFSKEIVYNLINKLRNILSAYNSGFMFLEHDIKSNLPLNDDDKKHTLKIAKLLLTETDYNELEKELSK